MRKRSAASIQIRTLSVFLAVGLGFAMGAPAQAGTVWIVDSAGDGDDSQVGDGACATGSGGCTLRAAIQEANAHPGPDTILFAIGSGVQTIAVGAPLPTIVDPVTIDGTTQPGFAGTPIVVVNGSGAGHNVTGITITAGGSTLRGLVVNGFDGDGVELHGGGGNVMEGSYIGLDVTGTTGAGNGGCGLLIDDSPDNRIGGTSPTQRNLISGNTGKGNGGGIKISGAGGNVIQGNFIGTDVTGTQGLGNQGRGIAISGSSNNLIGGAVPGAGNLISANRATGVRMLGGSNGNVVQANLIGTDRTGMRVLGNDRGVQIRSGNDNQVLGNLIAGQRNDGVLIFESSANNLVQGNIIAFNGYGPAADIAEAGYSGVWVLQGSGNRVLSNSIFGNARLGIHLGAGYDVTPNDPGDGDAGANGLQNFPTLTSATLSPGATTTISGALNSAAGGTFLIEGFANPQCDASGHGEGLFPIGQMTATANGAGDVSFSVPLGLAIPAGWVVTATATDAGGNTSEFSPCATVR